MSSRNQSIEFTTIHEEPFPLQIILQSLTCRVASAVQTALQVVCLSIEMMYIPHPLSTAYFHHERNFKLVARKGICININGDYDEKDYTLVE
jgi:hypothetical protein